ncbi:glycine cleavage system aminomethyltransferase GcvT [Deltaproteobacteria bacterium TL4]
MSTKDIQVTPFHQIHLDSGALMVDFGGWHMPVRYSGDKKEHFAVRHGVGLFDVSHMGEILVRGEAALPLLQYLTCNDVAKLSPGRIHYNVLMSPQGGFVDDILVYQRKEQDYLVAVNASNQEKDFEWFQQHNVRFGAELTNASAQFAQLAIQGPRAVDVISKLTPVDVKNMKYYHFAEGLFHETAAIISRTGYTASDGFEVYFDPAQANSVWKAILEAGAEFELTPCGLGARDSLRIEGKMCLYGNDINEETNVLEAGLGGIVQMDKGNFIGKERLAETKQKGLRRKWVGFEMLEFGIPRKGYPILKENQPISEVTSGILSPTLDKPIGLAYLPLELSQTGSQFEIQIRKKKLKAQVVETPFYKIKR